MGSFKNKTVIITGSSSGIGAETAVHFAQQGSQVVLTARGREGLEKTAARCRQEAGTKDEQILIVTGDVTKQEDVKNIVKTTVERFGAIDVLVNNAGTTIVGYVQNTTVDDLDKMWQINTKSVYMMCQEAVPHLIKSKGSIVNVSSIAGSRPMPYCVTYGMAKAAVDHLTKCLALELGSKGVRVNSVNPGAIQTEIFTRPGSFVKNPEELDEFMNKMGACHPLGRIGQVEEVARAIVWLASDQASFTSGAILPVDGGRYATTWFPADLKK